jgi:outer membrane protein assembly factor BamB
VTDAQNITAPCIRHRERKRRILPLIPKRADAAAPQTPSVGAPPAAPNSVPITPTTTCDSAAGLPNRHPERQRRILPQTPRRHDATAPQTPNVGAPPAANGAPANAAAICDSVTQSPITDHQRQQSHATNVSRETSPSRRPFRIWISAFLAIPIILAACSGPPSPRGWAAARPLVLDGDRIVLVPHKGKLFAMPDNSSAINWQFPPRDRNVYPLSELAVTTIEDAIDSTSMESTAKNELKQSVSNILISGPSAGDFKDRVDTSTMSADEKSDIKRLVDDTTKFENDAAQKLRAIYGDLGLSSDGGTVFVASFRGVIYALDVHEGTARWMHDVGSELVGGIAVDGNTIYFGTKEDRVFAADARTGAPIWDFKADGEVWSTPVIDGDTVYLTSLNGSVYALNKDDGAEQWRFDGAGSGIAGRVTVDDGSVYVGSFDNKLYALDAGSGEMKWSAEGDNWFWATPVVQDGVVYAASLDGKVYAMRADDGTAAWDEPFDTGSPVRSAPVIVGDGLVVASRDARLHKLNLQTGQPVEGSPVLVGDESTVEADLAVGEGDIVYVVPRGASLHAFEAAEGLVSRGGFALPN